MCSDLSIAALSLYQPIFYLGHFPVSAPFSTLPPHLLSSRGPPPDPNEGMMNSITWSDR